MSPTGPVYATHRAQLARARRTARAESIREQLRLAVGDGPAASATVVVTSDVHAEVRHGERTVYVEDVLGSPRSWYVRRTLGVRWSRRQAAVAVQSLFA